MSFSSGFLELKMRIMWIWVTSTTCVEDTTNVEDTTSVEDTTIVDILQINERDFSVG